jgi:hypothetical protein
MIKMITIYNEMYRMIIAASGKNMAWLPGKTIK